MENTRHTRLLARNNGTSTGWIVIAWGPLCAIAMHMTGLVNAGFGTMDDYRIEDVLPWE